MDDDKIEQEVYDCLMKSTFERVEFREQSKRILNVIKELSSKENLRVNDFPDSWWERLEDSGIYGLEHLYKICEVSGCRKYFQEVVERSFPPEIIIFNYMVNHSKYALRFFSKKKTSLKKDILYEEYVHNVLVDGENKKIVLHTSIGNITYSQATDKYLVNDVVMKKNVLNKRNSSDGTGRCHEFAYDLTKKIKGTSMTGTVDTIQGRVIHSWVEKDDDCIDIANNVVLEKSDFYRLRNPEVWNSLSYQEISDRGIPALCHSPFLEKDDLFWSLAYYGARAYVLSKKLDK